MNALLDLEFWRDKSPLLGIRLHHGFELAASLVMEDVTQFLRADMPILVCGHSLGAAEAIIVGMMLSNEGYRVGKSWLRARPK